MTDYSRRYYLMYKERFRLNYLAKRAIIANTTPVPEDYYLEFYRTMNARFRTQNYYEFISIIFLNFYFLRAHT